MNPDRHADAHWDFYNHLVEGDGDSAEAHRRFYDEYNAVLDMPAEYYLDTIKTVFQEFALPKGRMFVREQLVRPQAIRKTALLTIEGELDDISGNGQTEAAHAAVHSDPGEEARALSRAGRRPLRHLQRPALARDHLPEGAELHPQARLEFVGRSGLLHHGFLHQRRATAAARTAR